MAEKILIVDDEPVVRRVLRRMLEREGYQLIEAGDGEDAVAKAKEHRPSLVLLDLHMPGMDGLAALDALLGADPKLRVIMVTGDGEEEHARAAMQRGACDYLSKPVEAETLRTSVMANLLARG